MINYNFLFVLMLKLFLLARGLDIVSANNVVKIMRKLADSGKTIICTIHQASASHLANFDTVYVLTPSGQCMYNGKSSQIIDYFSQLGYQCPPYHNPADYGWW